MIDITYGKSQGFEVYKSQTKVILLDEKYGIKIWEIKSQNVFWICTSASGKRLGQCCGMRSLN